MRALIRLVPLAAGALTPCDALAPYVVLRRPATRQTAAPSCGLYDAPNIVRETREALVKEAQLEIRATLVELPVMFTEDKPGASFDFDRWGQHRSSSRYLRLLVGVLLGVTTRRISGIVSLLVTWSAMVDAYSKMAAVAPSLPEFALPLTPFELTAPVLGLLLVFRTNTAYERFNVGSDASWAVTSQLRSLVRQLIVYSTAPTVTSAEREAAFELIDAFVMLHGWLMTSYLREQEVAGGASDPSAVLRLALWGDSDAHHLGEGPAGEGLAGEGLAGESLTPWLSITTLAYAMMVRLPSIEASRHSAMDYELTELTRSLGTCERLLRTPIPLGYTRYSVRFLWIWLTLLPFALTNTFMKFGDGTWWEDKPQPVVVIAMLFIGFIFLSIEDIAVQIEEPFAVLPLDQHHQWLQRDAEQMKRVLRYHQSRADPPAAISKMPLTNGAARPSPE